MAPPVTNSTVLLPPGFENETRAPELLAATIAGPAIAAIFVAMRLYTRLVLVRRHFLEDYSIVAAWVRGIPSSPLRVSCLACGFQSDPNVFLVCAVLCRGHVRVHGTQ